MKRVSLAIDNKLFEKLQKIAENDERSINNLLTILIKKYVTQEPRSVA